MARFFADCWQPFQALLQQGLGLLAVVAVVWGSGCTPGFEGQYSDPAKTEIIDDKWNNTDARKTAQVMIKSMLEKAWLGNYKQRTNGKRPFVVVGVVENRSDEHVDTLQLTDFMRTEMINSGKVRFLAKKQRDEILNEIKYQQSGNVRADSAKKLGRQYGADYLLTGNLSSIVEQSPTDSLKAVTYQTTLELTNIETAELEWTETYQIRKKFKRSGVGL